MKIKDLRLALSAAPKKDDIRFYLNGVNVTDDSLVGSDGQRLCHVHTYLNEIPKNHEDINVPTDTVKALLKKVGTKHEGAEVAIFLTHGRYEITCLNVVEVFMPIDHKYPDFKEHLNNIKNNRDKNLNKTPHQFNWQYVAEANNAISKYLGNSVPKILYSTDQLGYFMPAFSTDIIYIVMPIRN
jgi:DNA polymerase III sliding clamp (beta) subunit (PCNA family)